MKSLLNKKQKKNLIRIIVAAAMTVALILIQHFLPVPKMVMNFLFLAPYFLVGYDVLKKAAVGIIHGQIFDENFLMTVATVGAIILGENAESVAVMLFYQVGELFQSVAVGKSRKNIAALMDIRPDTATMEKDGELETVDPDEVPVGSIIVVKPGEKIPLDGVIEEGTASLNTSALTGESMPREVAAGDEVISGCVNITGVLRIRTTKAFEESTVSKILELVENSSMKKARTEQFITRFARYYTPIVCLSALALAVLPPVILAIMGNDPMIKTWVIRALTFLVISCPCALVISIPLSFFGGIGGAGSKGILVKGSTYLEVLAQAGTIVFDKTGTLTRGVFEVTEISPSEGYSREELLSYAAHAEHYSNHPISRSIREVYGKEADGSVVSDVEEVGGHGVRAVVDGKQVLAGNRKLMDQKGIKYVTPDAPGTEIHVAVDGSYAGYLLVSDRVKDGAKDAITRLKAQGVTRTVMLTGDNAKTAEAAAKEIGVDEFKSGLLPEDKVNEVERLLEEKPAKTSLAFVGDGVNDAPVLSRADLGIAMGALGSDAAIEAADVVLMDDDPRKIALAMKIARKTLAIAKENIVFALTVKILFLVLGALGLVNMWWAIFADVGVMVLAVLNAMRTVFASPSDSGS